jgi:hypothetical protein
MTGGVISGRSLRPVGEVGLDELASVVVDEGRTVADCRPSESYSVFVVFPTASFTEVGWPLAS